MDNIDTIFRDRAKKTAQRLNDGIDAKRSLTNMVEFTLVPERFAFEQKYVQEVLLLKEITSIPSTPDFIQGVINLRGKIISVVNLKLLLGLKEKGLTDMNKVLIICYQNMIFGIVADSIQGNNSIDLGSISSPPLSLDSFGNEFIDGITTDGLIILNALKILTSELLILK